jgi:ferrous iron transport protein B
MLSSHACAIPGIMGARSIDNHRDRLATMFVAPFMSCGARLPVYALLIGVFLAPYGPALQSLTLFGCYSLGILVAIATALVLKKTALKAPPSAFLLELPTYQWPDLKQVSRIVWRNSFLFIKKAGTVILGFSILLWASLYYPRMSETQQQTLQQEFITSHTTQSNSDQQEQAMQDFLAAKQVEQSWSGRLGKAMEPAIAPLGYDWKIGIGLIGAFAAREVFVSTMGVVYSIGEDADEASEGLHQAMEKDQRSNGDALWNLPTVFSVLVFFVIAMQCISTVAVMRQETGGWKWPLIQLFSMNGLAYVMAFLVFQIGSAL